MLWPLLLRRHDISRLEPLIALLEAYEHIRTRKRVDELVNNRLPEENAGCLRCGMCCAFMQPGPVSFRTYGKWMREEALIADFFKTFQDCEYPAFHCWYFAGVRLRVCPFLLRNVSDGKAFCALHHMGSDQRHPACSTYRPNPPLCTALAFSLEN